MKTALTITNPTQIANMNDVMKQACLAANQEAARRIFVDHTARKANNTIRRKIADLALFEVFLQEAGVPAVGLYEEARSWRGVTWGLVDSFKVWQLQQGYAIGSINGRLSTVRTFVRLAAKAGVIAAEESILIASVEGYAHKEAKHIDGLLYGTSLPLYQGRARLTIACSGNVREWRVDVTLHVITLALGRVFLSTDFRGDGTQKFRDALRQISSADKPTCPGR